MRRHPATSMVRHAYDTAYGLFGFITGRTLLSFVPTFILLPIWLAYTRGGFMLYPIVSLLVVSSQLTKGSVPLPIGRRERLTAGLVRMVALTCVAVFLTWAITLTANLYLPFLPEITLKGHTFRPMPLPIWGPLIVLVVQPLAYTIGVWLKRYRAMLFVFWLPIGALGGFFAHKGIDLVPSHWLIAIGLGLAIPLVMLRYHFLRRDLV
jgi:hypothetical protein